VGSTKEDDTTGVERERTEMGTSTGALLPKTKVSIVTVSFELSTTIPFNPMSGLEGNRRREFKRYRYD
jgi:hypothetical protein